MKPEEQRIKIAEACGWSLNSDWQRPGIGKWWEHKEDIGNLKRFDNLPDYLNDLNAMHEAEKVLDDEQYSVFAVAAHEDTSFTGWLFRIMVRRVENPNFRIHSATAEQRAEAFLRTLNLWED